MKILVTGAAGFIGSHLVARLLNEGHRVVGIDDFCRSVPEYHPAIKRKNIAPFLTHKEFTLIVLDIRDRGRLQEALKGWRFDVVVHLAARAGVRPSFKEPVLYQEVNLIGTINLLDLFKGPEGPNFIFGSSSSVYGGASHLPFSEEDPADCPLSPYAASKRSAELYCRYFAHSYSLPITVLRFFTVYGPGQRPEMVIHKFARLIYEKKTVPIYGDGRSSRDYTYIDDIIDGVMEALTKRFPFEIINLGGSHPIELNRVVSLLEERLGKKAEIVNLPPHAGEPPTTYADISKAKRLLNFQPKISFEEGMDRFADWFLKTRGSG